MNKTLLKYNFKSHSKFITIFIILIVFYLAVIISLIDPQEIDNTQDIFQLMEGFLSFFGIDLVAMSNPLSYTATTFFGGLLFIFIIAFQLILIIPLFITPVQDTSLSYLLSFPLSRKKYLITQISFLIGALLLVFVSIFTISVIMLTIKGGFNILALLNLVSIMFFLNLAVMMISTFLAVSFSHHKNAKMLSSTSAIGFLFLYLIGNLLKEKTKVVLYLSPFGWINPVSVVNNSFNVLPFYFIYGFISAIFFSCAIIVFKKKRLAI